MRACCFLMFASVALAQTDSGPLLRHTFEMGSSGWMVFGQGNLQAVNGALEFSYEIKAKLFSAAVLPAPAETAHLKRIRFRVRADHDTAVGVLLSERKPNGGNYVATLHCPGGVWQSVELTAADFVVSDGPNDPVDPDGKLDLDQVEGIGILDLAQFFLTQLDKPEVPIAIDRHTGSHKLQVQSFEMWGGAEVPSRPALSIDRFDRGYLEWVTLGGIKLKLSPAADNPLKTGALEAKYEQIAGPLGVMVRRLSQVDLSQAGGIAFDIASQADATVVISLELRDGRRFSQTIYPPPAREVFHVNLKFSDFQGQGALDPAKLKSLTMTDISGAEGSTGENTLWISNVEGVR